MRSCCVACSGSIQAKPADRTHASWVVPYPGFGVRLDEQRTRLGEKLTYTANQWDGLLAFLYDGRVEIDSNFVENQIRPVKLCAAVTN